MLGRLATRDGLARRHVPIENLLRPLCIEALVSAEHLFTGCFVAMVVWQAISEWCNIEQIFAFSVTDLLQTPKLPSGDGGCDPYWLLVYLRFPARLARLANLQHEMEVELFYEDGNGEPFEVRQEMNMGRPRFNISGWMGFVNDKGIHLGQELRLRHRLEASYKVQLRPLWDLTEHILVDNCVIRRNHMMDICERFLLNLIKLAPLLHSHLGTTKDESWIIYHFSQMESSWKQVPPALNKFTNTLEKNLGITYCCLQLLADVKLDGDGGSAVSDGSHMSKSILDLSNDGVLAVKIIDNCMMLHGKVQRKTDCDLITDDGGDRYILSLLQIWLAWEEERPS
ncbi:hypothetical protein SSX86_030135 [Deinandra increscens subsp. villosa]|uniref:Uncharacterized protein n=1 Tax=Deinandra increscens subsp. villosa TaxID=3103831 RepID=A0AAP0CBG3_9ASTR